jgi:hypothetical protein
MGQKKNLSNPFSTGGGGFRFESHVQASFVALMLTGGYAPCLPCWPISEIKLQGKIDGFDTDDLIVTVKNENDKDQRKLLGQVKHSISLTKGNTLFGEVLQAAWNDFNNPEVFVKDKDIIALITGPLNSTDSHNVQWLLNQARHTKNVDEFFRNVYQANFSPPKSSEKLEAFQAHLRAANKGVDLSKDDLYNFLKHFYLIGYDLDNEYGVVLSLLHSHISQFQQQYPQWVWSRVVDFVQTWNQDAGTITPNNLSEDLKEAFKQKIVVEIPEEFKAGQEIHKTDWTQHPDATYICLAVLIGSWQEKNNSDIEAITQFLGISYEQWQNKARELLHSPDSPLSLKNGVWKVLNRTELWNLLGSRLLDQNLDSFRFLTVSVLKESDPAFELNTEERYAASIYGKALKHSIVFRKGIAEGLAILGTRPEACVNCSQRKAETTCILVIRELLAGANWILWGSLNELLPLLSEAAPSEFLATVDRALAIKPCPFDELFSQESNGISGNNYLTGLFWALEGLAWDEEFLVYVCVTLGELASHDPGGKWLNRPSNSLATILLPWLPQTLASVEKRIVAVETLLKEWPDQTWNLLLRLIPNQHQTSSGSHKPEWRRTIPDGWKQVVKHEEYWQQVSFYAELAVVEADQKTDRLSQLIDYLDSLPHPAFDQLLDSLSSSKISELSEENRLSIWNHLTKFINKHRRFPDAKWALSEELISKIVHVADKLAPKNPFFLYQHLFIAREFHLYDDNVDWEGQRNKLARRRETAISEIFQHNGIDGIIQFTKSVSSSRQVGYALGNIVDSVIEETLFPFFLDPQDKNLKEFVSGFIWRRFQINGWEWCDGLDKFGWTPAQIGQFLAYLPFTKESWDRASNWLQKEEGEYWTRTFASAYEDDGNLNIAIDKLIEYGRPHEAINCLDAMRNTPQIIDIHQCFRALFAALSSSEPSHVIDQYHIVELIKFLQSEPSVDQEELFRLEWAYLPILDHHNDAAPRLLETRLATDPKFFCKVIQLIYQSTKEDHRSIEPSEESITIANNAWRLLQEWRTIPGTQQDGSFSEERFTEWLQSVKEICSESGHLEVALVNIGEVLIHSPPDPDGLWIHRTIASALNDRKSAVLRNGFRSATYNSRGVHWVDPTGNQERELAEQFRDKAEKLENAGFLRFAVKLKGLAEEYEIEAENVIIEHRKRTEE